MLVYLHLLVAVGWSSHSHALLNLLENPSASQRPKIPTRPHHMGVRCVGRSCHLHSFPVFTSVIDSCIPIFTKPLFHCFPPVLIPSSHTSLSIYSTVLYLYLSLSSPHHIADASFSTHLLSLFQSPGAGTYWYSKTCFFSSSHLSFVKLLFFFFFFFSEYISTPWPSFIFKREAQRQSCLWLVDVRRWMVVSPLGHGSEFGEP